jgi:arginine/lysine/histidine transport system permease protein
MNIDFTRIIPRIPYILEGVQVTLTIALVAALIGSILGFTISLITSKKGFLGKVLFLFVDFFRGTPLYFQLFFYHYGLPQVIPGFLPTAFHSAFVIFSINSAAYLSEIFRAGIQSIDKGQIEAARALNISTWDIVVGIIIPIGAKNVLPAIINEFITLIKETSVAAVISVNEIMRRHTIVAGTTFRAFESLIIVGLIYYTLTKTLSIAGKVVERNLRYDLR